MHDTLFPTHLRHSHIIEERILHAILDGRMRAGHRLGENELCETFEVSRTIVREALIRLQARGVIRVYPRKGWFVVEPSQKEAHDVIAARSMIERGALRETKHVSSHDLYVLRSHVEAQQDAINREDIPQRSYLLGHFHVVLMECVGNDCLASLVENLTLKTVLLATLYQTDQASQRSCTHHKELITALEWCDYEECEDILKRHFHFLECSLNKER